MRPSWLLQLDARVPRYTSYPTAPHFHAGIGPTDVEGWLAAADLSTPLSLYIHIPFCRKLCWYCGCNTSIVTTEQPLQDHVRLLAAELDLIAARLSGRARLGHLHFGGGSPDILSAADFARLMDHIAARFDIEADAEIALELDPRGVDEARARAYAGRGVTRVSFGVQDFDPAVQRAISRIQPFATVAAAADQLRRFGIRDLNFDLLYGLPRQTPDSITATAEAAASLGPGRVALFGYAHVPWMKKHQKALERFALPGMAARADLATAARAVLERSYVPIGIDHFAAPGDSLARAAAAGSLARNFQGYTTDRATTLLAAGPSGIAATAAGYAQNETDPAGWAAALQAGRLPVARGFARRPADRLRGEVIERLMCDLAVDLEAVARRHGADPSAFAFDLNRLAPFSAEGMVTLDGWRVAVPAEARIALRSVAAVFDGYLDQNLARHAAAV